MSQEKTNIAKLGSFIALLLSALLLIITNVLPLLKIQITGPFFNALVLAKDISLLIGIAFGAYSFAKGTRKKGWIITYWIALAIYICCAVLGLFRVG